jgi:predicted RNA-binding protein with PIN domain
MLAILIDGYNVIRTTQALSRAEKLHGLAAGRDALLKLLASAFADTADRVYVIFDGAGEAESHQSLPGIPHGHLIFSRRSDSADTLISRLRASDELRGYEVAVVSSDEEVRREAAMSGATTFRADALIARLNRAPTYLRQRQRARLGAQMRGSLVDEDGEPIRPSRKGNGHRAPRGRRGSGYRSF